MKKKTLSLILWLIVSVIVFSICYIVGVLKNWSDTTTGLYWISIILITLLLKWTVDCVRNFFSSGKYKVLLKYCSGKRESAIYSNLINGLKILKKRGRGKVPWFLLTGYAENNNSLLKDVKLPLFNLTGKNNIIQPIRSLRWWFFSNVSVLELSVRIYNDFRIFNSVIKFLASRTCKRQPPSGMIIILPANKLLDDDCSDIQLLAQNFRNFTEQLSVKLKYNIPVYLIISRCEEICGYSILTHHIFQRDDIDIPGFFWLADTLPDNRLGQDSLTILSALKVRVTAAIYHILDDSLSEKEKYSLLHLPEKMMGIEKSLNVFLSNFCTSNVYFSPVSLSGVWLSGSMQSVRNKQESMSEILVLDILPKIHKLNFSSCKNTIKKNSFQLIMYLTILCFLGYSAYRTSQIISTNYGANPELLIQAILKNEKHMQSPVIYFPFSIVLNIKHFQISETLRQDIKFKKRHVSEITEEYKKIYAVSSPQDRRDMILSLASSLISWEKMRNNDQLSDLSKYPDIPELLRLTRTEEVHSSLTALAIERGEIQGPEGARNIDVLRGLLTELINNDPSFSWLVSDYVSIPDVKLSKFWADAENSVYLPGIWTSQGLNMLNQWYKQIKDAYGDKVVPEALSSFVQRLNESRQDNFREFIIAVGKARQNSHSGLMTSLQLIDIIQNRSSEQKFFQFIDKELQDIPATSAQDWLIDFRLFYRLHSLERENKLIRQIKQSDLMLRMNLLSVFDSNLMPGMSERITAWWDWQDAFRSVVSEELNTSSSVNLIKKALLSDRKSEKNNKLVILFEKFEYLNSFFTKGDTDPVMGAIWSIYKQLAYQLLDNAAARTECWIDEQWKQSVLRPLNTGSENVDHAIMQSNVYQHIIGFLHSSAKDLMVLDPEGVRLLSFKGRTISFLPSFIRFINEVVAPDDLLDVQFRERTHDKDNLSNLQGKLAILNERQQKLESQPYKVMVNSAPATISSTSRIKPTGTHLELECKTGNSDLRSMNFADSGAFTWYPGQCHTVNINIDFPAFTATYAFTGDSAWIDFINKFSEGEAELLTDNFQPETKLLLETMDIKSILVRYKISDATSINHAYIEWYQLKQQIDKQEKLQDELNDKLSSKKAQEQSGWLSRLPKNITTCQILQE